MRPIDSIAPIKGTNRAEKFRPARFFLPSNSERKKRWRAVKDYGYVGRIREMVSRKLNQTKLEKVDSFTLYPFVMRFLFVLQV